ncbi:MAG: hypothetical protein H6Q36_1834 [Chloroflexi bacterium]|nr:hypothetical protein [Chloroflexota bacterium]
MAGAAGLGGVLGAKSLAVLAAGLTVGIVGGSTLVASGAVSFDRDGGATGQSDVVLVVYPCPDQGPPLGKLPRGQQVLVTGRSEGGTWLQIYWPAPGTDQRGWVKGGLEVDGNIKDLPIARCDAPPEPTRRPTPEPTASPTRSPEPTASPSPTPSPTASASPKPNAGPKVSGLTASRSTISYDTGSYCPSSPTSVAISVSASDHDGVASVTLYFRRPGASAYSTKPMSLSDGKWTATLDTKADGIKTAGTVRYYVIATDKDASPTSTRSPKSGYLTLTVKVCQNTGPRITSRVADPTTVWVGPDLCQGYVGNSQITVKATDQDGVKSLTLYFKGPGRSTWTKRSLALEGAATSVTGYGDIDPGSEGITSPGTISWYVVATDQKGARTTSSKKSITVKRCDQEAKFELVSTSPSSIFFGKYCSPTYPTIDLNAMAMDADGLTRVTLQWQLSPPAGAIGRPLTGSQTIQVRTTTGWQKLYFQVQTTSSWFTGRFYWRLSTTDQYGGTTNMLAPGWGPYNTYDGCIG